MQLYNLEDRTIGRILADKAATVGERTFLTFGGERWTNTLPGSWISIFAVAAFSYYAVERPALRLRRFC